MSTYKCRPCKYATHDKSNFTKHLSSKKHQEKVNHITHDSKTIPSRILPEPIEQMFVCCFCEKEYSTSSNLSKHKKVCSVRIEIESSHQTEIDNLKKEFESEKMIIDGNHKSEIIKLRTEINNLKKDHKHLQQLYDHDTRNLQNTINNLKEEIGRLQETLNNAGNIIKTSVSTTNYIIKNFRDAPALAAPEDYSRLTYDRPKGGHEDEYELSDTEEEDPDDPGDKFIDKDSDDEIKLDKGREKEKFVEKLLYKHRENILVDYLSRIIVRHYKKKDPSQQSIFNSDTTRLTYIVRELFSNKKIDWRVDKKGIKTTNYVIKPLLKHIDELIREYIDQKTTIDRKTVTTEQLINNFDNLKSGNEILHSIEKNELSENVLKKISPHFYFIKNDSGLLEE